MSKGPFLDTADRRRRRLARERRRRARRRGLLVLLAFVALPLAVFGVVTAARGPEEAGTAAGGPEGRAVQASAGADAARVPRQTALGPLPGGIDLADTDDPVRLRFKRPPRSALLVDLDTGEVLWRHRADRTLPIASLTKMMTALVAVEELGPAEKVRIRPEVLNYRGSGMGVLRRGRRVKADTLLHGLMLASGNDAAKALAFGAAGSVPAMVRRMNEKAGELGLQCTSFASVEGLSARNRSCPADLALMARTVLDSPRLARIVKRRRAILPYAIKGGRIFLYNTNPLLREGYPGILGVKTGFTNRAGRCLVAVARRRGVRLAAIVLHSPDPGRQARQMLDRGFRALR